MEPRPAGIVLAGLAAAVLAATAVMAQAPRTIIIIPNPLETPAVPPPSDISPARIDLLNATVKVENPAGVSVDVIPKPEVSAGSKLGFRIATRKAGYVILLDVDAAGKLTQIFPDPTAAIQGEREASNFIRPGRPLTIPQLGTRHANFEFVADPPAGIALAVALLSDRPVQVVDLPNAPPPTVAPGETLKFVQDQVRALRVPDRRDRKLEQPTWSIAGKFYLIRWR